MSISFFTEGAEDINMNNRNALLILGAIGVDAEKWGLEVREIPDAVRGCIRIINSDRACEARAVKPSREGNFFVGGADAEYIRRRAGDLLALFRHAQERGQTVSWG
jgi:hypothetical protein